MRIPVGDLNMVFIYEDWLTAETAIGLEWPMIASVELFLLQEIEF
jgi:hypothetical protein